MGKSCSPVGVRSQMSLAQLSFQPPASTQQFLGVGSPDLVTALGWVVAGIPGFPSEQLLVQMSLAKPFTPPQALF